MRFLLNDGRFEFPDELGCTMQVLEYNTSTVPLISTRIDINTPTPLGTSTTRVVLVYIGCYMELTAPWPLFLCRTLAQHKDRNLLTGADKDIFGRLTLNNRSITSYRTLVLCSHRWKQKWSGNPWRLLLFLSSLCKGNFRTVNLRQLPRPLSWVQFIRTGWCRTGTIGSPFSPRRA